MLALAPVSAHAYLGPGMGGGAIAAILGLLGAIVLGLFSVIYYPLKRSWKKRQQSKVESDEKNEKDKGAKEEKEDGS
jgi:hypothetical protein